MRRMEGEEEVDLSSGIYEQGALAGVSQYKVEKVAHQGDGSDERTSVVASYGSIRHVDGSLDTFHRGFVFLVMHASNLEKGSKGGDSSGDYDRVYPLPGLVGKKVGYPLTRKLSVFTHL